MGGWSLFARRFAIRFENRVDKAVLRSRLDVPASKVSCASPDSALTPAPRTIRWILGSAILQPAVNCYSTVPPAVGLGQIRRVSWVLENQETHYRSNVLHP